MTQLVIDMGNTNAKLALFADGRLALTDAVHYPVDDAVRCLTTSRRIDEAIVSSVAAAAGRDVCRLLQSLGVPAIEVSVGLRLPFAVGYLTPQTLGADRLAAVAGAVDEFGSEGLLVVDAGTAVTYELVTGGVYVGGNISPGLQVRFASLHEHTARLPLVDERDCTGPWGRDTRGAIAAGVVRGLVHEIDGYIDRARDEMKIGTVVMTGGNALYLSRQLRNNTVLRPDLVLFGLRRILSDNR